MAETGLGIGEGITLSKSNASGKLLWICPVLRQNGHCDIRLQDPRARLEVMVLMTTGLGVLGDAQGTCALLVPRRAPIAPARDQR